MAISKIVYHTDASDTTGTTWMDVTPDTVTASKLLSGETATDASGTQVTGNIATKTSTNLSVSGATVTAPAGYYASDASKSVSNGSATTPATTVTANPTISVNSSTGLITATTSATKSVTPTVSAGYVSSGTAGTITVSGSNSNQLTVQAAQTIHPSTTDQTIASGKYLTGTQTVKAVTMTNLSAENIAEGVTVKVGDSTDDDCVVSVTGTFQGGTTPTGVKYVYSDVEGLGAWDVSGYTYCSYDYAPLRDGKMRLWYKVNSTVGMTVTAVVYARANQVIIDWGDGTTEYAVASPYTNTHTYQNAGIYCVELSDPTNNRMSLREYAVGQSNSIANETLVGAEILISGSGSASQSALRNCTRLKRVTVNGNCLNTYYFYGCANLEMVDLSQSQLTSIDSYLFYGCVSLKSVTIPATVTGIYPNAFGGCSGLIEIHFMPTTPPTVSNANAWTNVPTTCKIYVPSGTLADYTAAANYPDPVTYTYIEE